MAGSDVQGIISDVARRYLRLQLTTDVGPIRVRKLIQHFGSLDAVLSASMAGLERVEGIGSRVAKAIFRSRQDDVVDQEVARADQCGLRIVCAEDDD